MARAYSQDLRDRVIDAALGGMPARRVAAQFEIGVATAIVWVRRVRASGERTARRQGQPRRSKLDPQRDLPARLHDTGHDDRRDATAACRGARHQGERGHHLDLPRPLRPDVQKKTAHAAEQDRPDILKRREAWFDGPARTRSRQTGLHRRDRRGDQDGPPAWPGSEGRAAACRHPARPLEDHHLRRRAQAHRHDRADGARRPDERRRLPGLRRAGAGAGTQARRHRHHGQPVPPTRAARCARRSRRPAQDCSTCRPTAPTSTRSRRPSPSSRRCCARPPSAPSTAFGNAIGKLLDAFTPNECANYFAAAGYDPD